MYLGVIVLKWPLNAKSKLAKGPRNSKKQNALGLSYLEPPTIVRVLSELLSNIPGTLTKLRKVILLVFGWCFIIERLE